MVSSISDGPTAQGENWSSLRGLEVLEVVVIMVSLQSSFIPRSVQLGGGPSILWGLRVIVICRVVGPSDWGWALSGAGMSRKQAMTMVVLKSRTCKVD